MASSAVSSKAARRWGAGTAAVVRLLVATDTPATGVAIAKAVGVSQPRVSQILTRLTQQQAVESTEYGYLGKPSQLLDLYRRRTHPLLAGPETYWYSTRPLAQQARRILDAPQPGRSPMAFSADLAPDLLVPWRHPTIAVVYTPDDLSLDPAGCVPAEGRADASIIVRWTSDGSLLSPAAGWPRKIHGIPVTDPVQQWWDLLDLGGDDRLEAAEYLRQAIIDRTLPTAT